MAPLPPPGPVQRIVSTCAENDHAHRIAERILRMWDDLVPRRIDLVRDRGADEIIDDADAIFAFGGDGHLLEVVRNLGGRSVPIVGWHAGHMGFLMNEVPQDDGALRADLMSIASGAVEVMDCSPLRVDIEGSDLGAAVRFPFNEVAAFVREIGSQAARLAIEIDGESMGTFTGDGILLSSSQGTTGYAVHAGGPAVDPSVPSISLVPVNANRSSAFPSLRLPVVLPPTSSVVLRVLEREKRPVQLSMDGAVVERDLREIRVSTGLTITPPMIVRLLYPYNRDGERRRRFVRQLRRKFVDQDGGGDRS